MGRHVAACRPYLDPDFFEDNDELLCSGCHNTIPQTGKLKNRRIYFSQFQSPKSRSGRVLFMGRTLSRLVHGHLSSHGFYSEPYEVGGLGRLWREFKAMQEAKKRMFARKL